MLPIVAMGIFVGMVTESEGVFWMVLFFYGTIPSLIQLFRIIKIYWNFE